MNKEKFYQEVQAYIQQLREGFCEYQAIVWGALTSFHEICVQNGIPYQAAFGTLLGIYRDNGQIPWDYDIDVLVKYEYRSELIAALKRQLGDEFLIDCLEENPLCESYKVRITPVGYDPMRLHVDVFFVVPVSDIKKEQKREIKKYSLYSKIRRYKTGNEKKYSIPTPMKKLDLVFNETIFRVIPLQLVDDAYFRLANDAVKRKTKYYILADRWSDYRMFPSHLIDNVKLVQVGVESFYIPENVEEMLKLCYGNNLGYAPIQKRFEEWYTSCSRLDVTQKK